MKGLPCYLSGLALFYLIGLRVMTVNVISIEAQGLTAEQLLAQKEEELNIFVGAVEANSFNCSALIGCSSSGDGCSRLDCYKYGTPDDPNYKCLGVFNNTELCGAQCKERNFDFSKGFVRRVDTVDSHIARTVCTHRTLDDHFRSSSMNDIAHFFRVFFGAVDGTTRIYPGADGNCNDDYDPRTRPWFIQSTYVPKVVTVLIDSGLNMRDNTTHSTETYLNKAINTALKFLETLREDKDYVNIMSFDGDGVLKPSNASSKKYIKDKHFQPFNDSLADIVRNDSVVKNPSALDTSHAINTAISQLNTSISISIPKEYLKVVIVLTSGFQFQTLSDLNIPANSGVNLFVYSFRTPNRTLECANSTIRAYSEGIPDERIDNPLYALESYYSFLAKIHKTFFGHPIDYGPRFPDYSGVDSNTLTLSKAAFGLSGELLGVVGIDFFENKVGEQYTNIQFQAIVGAATNKDPQKLKAFDTSKDLITPVCFNHTDPCPGLNTNVGGLCQERKGDAKIGCCGKCKSKKTEWGNILGGVAAGIVGLLVIAAIVYFTWPRIIKRLEHEKTLAESPNFVFKGPDNEPVDQGDTTGNFGRRAGPG